MILIDTSIWVDHLRAADAHLHQLLTDGRVLTHPFIIGELALGNLKQRTTTLTSLRELPQTAIADDDEVSDFIDRYALFGSGIGYVDAHLLAAVRLTAGTALWTRDKRLLSVAQQLQLAHGLN